MKKLTDKTVVVAGGTGGVGEGMVRQLLKEGAKVIVPTRSSTKAQDFPQYLDNHPKLRMIHGSVETTRAAQELVKSIQEKDKINAVIASVGEWVQGSGKLTDFSDSQWQHTVQSNLTAHFQVARAFLPLIAPEENTSYIMINGGSALMPLPNAGAMSVIAAAEISLKDVLAHEYADYPVRITTLLLDSPIATRARSSATPYWPTADDVGRSVVDLLSSDTATGETIIFNSRTS